MRIFNKLRDTRGFVSAWERAIRFRYMITEQAKQRTRILTFFKKYGIEATEEAFGVSRRTLFRWQKALKEGKGKLDSLNPKSRTPKNKRKREVSKEIEQKIILIRSLHPRLGKDKVWKLLEKENYSGSVSTIGRIIKDLKEAGKIDRFIPRKKPKKHRKKLRRPRGYRVLEVDTVTRFIDGAKRYILTAVDTEKRTAFAACYTSHGSRSAADFLSKTKAVLPDCPRAIQTDNGSEFALHFEEVAKRLQFVHFHTHPYSPKQNANVERFNRTLQEEFLFQKRNLLRDNLRAFNEELIEWLLWYNSERPHHSLGLKSPFQAMISELTTKECHMWWTYTSPCLFHQNVV